MPGKYLTSCNYGLVVLDESDIKAAFVQLAEYALMLQAEIDRCNDQIEYIKQYQASMLE